jgi:hypothetical protein
MLVARYAPTFEINVSHAPPHWLTLSHVHLAGMRVSCL